MAGNDSVYKAVGRKYEKKGSTSMGKKHEGASALVSEAKSCAANANMEVLIATAALDRLAALVVAENMADSDGRLDLDAFSTFADGIRLHLEEVARDTDRAFKLLSEV